MLSMYYPGSRYYVPGISYLIYVLHYDRVPVNLRVYVYMTQLTRAVRSTLMLGEF